MKLEKKDFNQKKYDKLIDYANTNNLIIVDKGSYYETEKIKEPIKTLEELKKEKKEELKQARDNYLKLNHYDFSENDKFNIMNLLDNYTESDRTNYIEFLKNDLIPKYNNFSNQIKETTINNIEELRNLNFDFTEELEQQ